MSDHIAVCKPKCLRALQGFINMLKVNVIEPDQNSMAKDNVC